MLFSLYIDINECAESTDGCAQTCINEIGGYSCSCGSGYRLASNRRGCLDINECSEGIDGCDHTCTNTIGSYTCSCNSGYRLASDRQVCNGEYKHSMVHLGQSFLNLIMTESVIHVLPTIGITLLTDIDECTEGTDDCVHSCSNVPGSYTCICNSGYRLASDNRGCEGMI